MTMTQALSALLANLEAATGPSRELDAAIAVAIFRAAPGMDLRAEAAGEDCEAGTYWLVGPSWRSLTTSQRYSESLDAAMALVPPGYGCSVSTPWRDKAKARACVADNARGYFDAEAEMHYGGHDAETPALALCIAALRARLAGQKE